MRKTTLTGLLALAFALSFAPVAHALIAVDVDFSATTGPGSPVGEGFTGENFNGAPTADSLIDTGLGIWDLNMVGGQAVRYVNHPLGASLSGTVLSGEIVVEHVAFSTSVGDSNMIRFRDKTNDWQVEMFALEGKMVVSSGDETGGGAVPTTEITVANTSGPHTYGWEVSGIGTAPIAKYFFDGSQVGDLAGYPAGWFFNEDTLQFGDNGFGSGVTHQDIYDSFTISESFIPEPASLVLAVLGALCLVLRQRRRR